MIAVIFEVFPDDGRKRNYLEYAARLKVELEGMDGFISVERFQLSRTPTNCCPCPSGVTRKRSLAGALDTGHRAAQSAGRKGVFATIVCALLPWF